MKITLDRIDLLQAAQFAAAAVKTKSALTVPTSLLFEPMGNGVLITGTDLEASASHYCPGDSDEMTKFAVPAKLFCDVIAIAICQDVQIEVIGDWAQLSLETRTVRLPLSPVQDWPILPAITGKSFLMEAKDLHKRLAWSGSAMADDSLGRPALEGINLHFNGGLTFTGADGRKLAGSTANVAGEGNIIISRKTAQMAISASKDRDGDAVVAWNDRRISFKFEDCEISGQLVDQNYPNIRFLLPEKMPLSCELNRKQLISELKSSTLVTMEDNPRVEVHVEREIMRIECRNAKGSHNGIVQCQSTGDISFAVHPGYLRSMVEILEGDTIKLEFKDQLSPIVIREGDFQCVTMPMRL